MNAWIKKNFNTILIIFILLQPIIDILTGIAIHVWQMNLTIGIVIRMIFLLFVLYSVLFVYKKKFPLPYYIVFIIYSILYIIGIILYKDGVGLFQEIQGLCRIFYFPTILIALYSIKEEIKISFMTLMVLLITYLLAILVPNCLNIGFKTYEITKAGTLGFFNSANEISGIISLLTPIMIIIFVNSKKIIPIILTAILYLIVILQIGTKTPLLSLGITISFTYIWFIYQELTKKRLKRIGVSLLILIIGIGIILTILPRTNFYKNIKTHLDFLEVDDITEIFQDEHLIDHFIFSERLTFLNNRKETYQTGNTYQKLFGIGYLKQTEQEKAVEMDYFDIYYSHGLFGFIIYFASYGSIFYFIMKRRKDLDFTQYMLYISILLSIFLSFFTGHIITAPAVSILVTILLLLLMKQEKTRILLIGENKEPSSILKNKIKKKNQAELTILLIDKDIPWIKQLYYQVITYKMYDKSYCYQNYDKQKEKVLRLSSVDNYIYMDKTNIKNKYIIENITPRLCFKNKKEREEFVKKYPKQKENSLVLDTK